MSQTTQELKQEFKKTLGLLQTLRDEVRVKLHLAGMDAKDEWSKLEDELELVDTEAEKFSDKTFDTVKEMLKKVRLFHARHAA